MFLSAYGDFNGIALPFSTLNRVSSRHELANWICNHSKNFQNLLVKRHYGT